MLIICARLVDITGFSSWRWQLELKGTTLKGLPIMHDEQNNTVLLENCFDFKRTGNEIVEGTDNGLALYRGNRGELLVTY